MKGETNCEMHRPKTFKPSGKENSLKIQKKKIRITISMKCLFNSMYSEVERIKIKKKIILE